MRFRERERERESAGGCWIRMDACELCVHGNGIKLKGEREREQNEGKRLSSFLSLSPFCIQSLVFSSQYLCLNSHFFLSSSKKMGGRRNQYWEEDEDDGKGR